MNKKILLLKRLKRAALLVLLCWAGLTKSLAQVTQTTNFAQGWNWWSTYIEQNGLNGLAMLESDLGSDGSVIKTQCDGYVINIPNVGWRGSLQGITNELTYMIRTESACSAEMTGSVAVPSNHPITLYPGWTWIGYPNTEAMSVAEALSNMTLSNGDQVRSQVSFCTYYSMMGMWVGPFQTITPGMGLQFKSNNNGNTTLVYPEGIRDAGQQRDITDNNHWTPNMHQYRDNMIVTGIVKLDGVEVQSNQFEVGAFVGDECRGSARPIYVQGLNRYVVFLTIEGENANDQVSFKLYNCATGVELEGNSGLAFIADDVVGLPFDVPYEFGFTGMTTYVVTTVANPAEGGTVTGTGNYIAGATCTLTATPAEGYTFINWTKNGSVVSTSNPYSFAVTESGTYVANFELADNDPLLYSINADGVSVTVTGHVDGTNATGEITIPETKTINGVTYAVTAISVYAFYDCAGLTGDLVIPNSVTTIGASAFRNCSGFTGSLTIGDGVVTMNDQPFQDCGFTGTLTLGNSLTVIPVNAFLHCHFTGTLELPSSVTTINPAAFSGCTFTGDLVLPNSLTSIGFNAFKDCTGFTGNLVIPNSLTEVGSWAFSNCPGFTGLTIGSGVETIEEYAFRGCTGLSAITSLAQTPPSMLPNAFMIVDHSIPVTVPCGSLSAYSDDQAWSTFTNLQEDCGGGIEGAVSGLFSVGDSTQVYFSQGNLQYIGSAASPYWKFAENQWDIIGSSQANTAQTTDRDLFCWGTSGYDHGANQYQPWSYLGPNSDYFAYGNEESNLFDNDGRADWGYNAIANGGNTENIGWRTLTEDEWLYLFNTRNTVSGIRFARAKVNDVGGIVFLPDNWNADTYELNETNNLDGSINNNIISADDWVGILEANGAVFLPIAGWMQINNGGYFYSNPGAYWSSTVLNANTAWYYDVYYYVNYYGSNHLIEFTDHHDRGNKRSVRLVINVDALSPTSYTINATPSPAEGGTVSGAGVFNQGSTCTLTATANAGYTFTNWTKEGVEVSTDATLSFTVTESASYVANFTETANDFHWDVNVSTYPNTMTMIGVIEINSVEQMITTLEIGAFCGDECRGRDRLVDTYYQIFGHYFVFLTVYGNDNDQINFRLYDHAIEQELDLTCSPLAFQTNGLFGNPGTPYVFDFSMSQTTQTTSLTSGSNWWSTYVEADDLYDQLTTGLGANASQIKSSTLFVNYFSGMWIGGLNSISNESCYLIKANNACTLEMTGNQAMPANHPITINPNWNWIGYPNTGAQSIDSAFRNFTPTNGDQVKSQNAFSTYFSGMWIGGLNTITPGMGLLYKSNNTGAVTLVYPEPNRSEELLVNITNESNHWTADYHAYPSNMTVMAVVELDDVELQGEHYELAAFSDGDCRGSARLMYVAPINRYVAFLTIVGDEASELRFSLYNDETGTVETQDITSLQYETNAIVGNLDNPFVVRFRSTTGVDEWANNVNIFPNPVSCGEQFSLGLPTVETLRATSVQIVNALGVVVETLRAMSVPANITAPKVAGVYTLRITVEGKGTCFRKLVVK